MAALGSLENNSDRTASLSRTLDMDLIGGSSTRDSYSSPSMIVNFLLSLQSTTFEFGDEYVAGDVGATADVGVCVLFEL